MNKARVKRYLKTKSNKWLLKDIVHAARHMDILNNTHIEYMILREQEILRRMRKPKLR